MAASGKEIKAGEAFVEFSIRDNKLMRGLGKLQAGLKNFGMGMSVAGGALMAAGGAILGGLGLMVSGAVEAGSALQDASDRTGVAVEELSELKHAAEQSAASFEDLEKAITTMQRKGFGAGAADLEKYADEIAGMEDPAKQTARAMEIFGKGGARLLPLLKTGAAGIAQLREESRRLGISMSGEDASAAEAFGDQIANLEKTTKAMRQQIGFALIPTLAELIVPLIEGARQVGAFVRENRAAAVGLAAVGVGAVAAGAAFTALGLAALGASAIMSVAGTIMGAIFSPVGIAASVAIAAVAALGVAWAAFVGQNTLKDVAADWEGFGERVSTAWNSARVALSQGNWGLAAKIAWGEVVSEALRVGKAIDLAWSDTIDYFLAGWSDAVYLFSSLFLDAIEEIRVIANKYAESLGLGSLVGSSEKEIRDQHRGMQQAIRKQNDAELDNLKNARQKKVQAWNDQIRDATAAGRKLAAIAAASPLIALGMQILAGQRSARGMPGLPKAAMSSGSGLSGYTKGTFSGSTAGLALGVSDKLADQLMKETKDQTQLLEKIEKNTRGQLELD